MKTLIFVGAVLLSVLFTNDSIVGSWAVTAGPRSYTFTFKSNNTYQVDFGSDGSIEVTGTYTLDGSKLVMKDTGGTMQCKGDTGGIYEVSLNGNEATFKMIEDKCNGRKGMNGVTMTRK